MPRHPDHETYRERRLNQPTIGDTRRYVDQLNRRRQEPVADPQANPDIYAAGISLPPAYSKGDGTQTFTPVSSTGYARYIGRAVPRLQEVDVLYRVTTIAATVTYAEIGLAYSETPLLAAGLSDTTLTKLSAESYADISAAILTTGRKLASISDFAAPNPGSYLWLILTIQATTPPILRGGIPSEAGVLMSKAGSARPSILGENAAFSEVSTATNDIWLPFTMIQG